MKKYNKLTTKKKKKKRLETYKLIRLYITHKSNKRKNVLPIMNSVKIPFEKVKYEKRDFRLK